MYMRRNIGLDIYRSLCCSGVLGYHVLDSILVFKRVKVLHYAYSFCGFEFFLLSEYFGGSKDEINFTENAIAKKIV